MDYHTKRPLNKQNKPSILKETRHSPQGTQLHIKVTCLKILGQSNKGHSALLQIQCTRNSKDTEIFPRGMFEIHMKTRYDSRRQLTSHSHLYSRAPDCLSPTQKQLSRFNVPFWLPQDVLLHFPSEIS